MLGHASAAAEGFARSCEKRANILGAGVAPADFQELAGETALQVRVKAQVGFGLFGVSALEALKQPAHQMIGKQGLGLGVVLGLLVASAQSGCGRSARESGDPDAQNAAGQSSGGEGSMVAAGASDLGVGGETPSGGGSGGAAGNGDADSAGAGVGGEGVIAGGAGPELCTPGSRSCDGPSVRVCNAYGQSKIEETCGPAEVCRDAECRPIVCVPSQQFCQAGTIRKCGEDGTESALLKTCAVDQFCREQDAVAECSATACSPNEPLCIGNVATTCKADGSGSKPGGLDCSAAAQLCDHGQCVDPTCTAGEKLCEHDDVYLCVGGGAKSVLFTECNADEVCDPALVACRNRICEPGKLGCDGTRTATCNALGTGWVQSGTDCAAADGVCVEGTCKPHVCGANVQFCQDSNAYQCDATGTKATLYQACRDYNSHCIVYSSSYTYCASNFCTPGTATCAGNVLGTCNADGSGVLAGGTDCGNDKVCSGNSCVPKVCEGNATFCKDGDISYCQGGVSSYVWTNCPNDAPCARTDTGVSCVPYKCWPGLKACMGNQLGTCADDGNALAVVKEDCSVADQVCVSTSSCGQTAVDALGEADDLASVPEGSIFGDIIDVQSNRALTELQANVVLAGSRDFRWCVFELVDSYYVSRYEKIVKGVSGSGYMSSGTLNYTLKAGKRYVLGVAVTGGSAVPYYDSVPWQPEVSFGKALGSISASYATSIYGYYTPSNFLYDLKITTVLP